MVAHDKNDKILSNIARIVEKRLPENADITLVLDKSMDKFDSKIENGVISAGGYAQLTDAAGRFIRNPRVNGEFHSNKEICGIYARYRSKPFYMAV